MTHRLESFREAPVRAVGALGVALCLAFAAGGTRATPPLVQAGQDSVANTLVVIISVTCIVVLLVAGRLAPFRVVR